LRHEPDVAVRPTRRAPAVEEDVAADARVARRDASGDAAGAFIGQLKGLKGGSTERRNRAVGEGRECAHQNAPEPPRDRVEECRLSGAARPEHGEHLARARDERDAAKDLHEALAREVEVVVFFFFFFFFASAAAGAALLERRGFAAAAAPRRARRAPSLPLRRRGRRRRGTERGLDVHGDVPRVDDDALGDAPRVARRGRGDALRRRRRRRRRRSPRGVDARALLLVLADAPPSVLAAVVFADAAEPDAVRASDVRRSRRPGGAVGGLGHRAREGRRVGRGGEGRGGACVVVVDVAEPNTSEKASEGRKRTIVYTIQYSTCTHASTYDGRILILAAAPSPHSSCFSLYSP
jgi:hypothetical protein